jgi:hypothetical protein
LHLSTNARQTSVAVRDYGLLFDELSGKFAESTATFRGMVDFPMPKSEGADSWSLLVDTNIPDAEAEEVFKPDSVYQVTGRSLLLFAVNSATAP